MDTENQVGPAGPEEDDVGMEVPEASGDESRTALLPLDFFQGKELKPGSQCKIKISRLLDGQAEVTYVSHNEGAEAPSPGEEKSEETDEEMAGYMNS